MQELQNQQQTQQEQAEEQEHRERMTEYGIRDSLEVMTSASAAVGDEGDGRLQGMLSDNLAVDSVSFPNTQEEEDGEVSSSSFRVCVNFFSIQIAQNLI